MAGMNGRPIVDVLRDTFNKGINYRVVFRELIQNADDCRSDWLSIGFSEGLADAEHPFLRDPALFAVNNGTLLPADVRAITSIGQGTKRHDAGSVGKFGLGLKSIFKMAELMFYADFRLNSSTPHQFGDITARERHYDVISPWLDDYGRESRQDWEPFSPVDHTLMHQHLKELGIDEGFAIWAPLRLSSHHKLSIFRYFDDQEDNDTEKQQLSEELLRVLPMLQHLQRVSYRHMGEDLIHITREGEYRQFLNNDQPSFRNEIHGTLQITDRQLPFLFHEHLEDCGELKILKTHEGWPAYECYDDGEEKRLPDPALPHGGVLWQELPIKHNQQSTGILEAGWSVFLPTADSKRTALSFTRHFRLSLHGYFFPDSDRRTLFADHTDSASEENRIKTRWNELLKQQIILPLILEGLPRITEHLTPDETSNLTEALKKVLRALDVCAKNAALTEYWQWIRTHDEQPWQRVSSKTPLLPFTAGHWSEVLESAQQLVQGVLYDPEQPHFVVGDPRWSEEITEQFLLNLHWETLLQSPKKIDWLSAMLRYLTIPKSKEKLVNRLREALKSQAKDAERMPTPKASKLLSELLTEHTLSLPKELREEWIIFNELPLSIILLPQEIENRGKLSEKDGELLIGLLNKIEKRQGLQEKKEGVKKNNRVVATLKFIQEYIINPEFLEDKKVVRIHTDHVSPKELHEKIMNDEKVYLYREGKEKELFEAIKRIINTKISCVSEEYDFLLNRHERSIQFELLVDNISEIIMSSYGFSGSFEDRLHLIKVLLRSIFFKEGGKTVAHKMLYRYLLHGNPQYKKNETEKLIYKGQGDNKRWTDIIEKILPYTEKEWLYIDDSLDSLNLTSKQKENIGLTEATTDSVNPLLIECGNTFPFKDLTVQERERLITELPTDSLNQLCIFETEEGSYVGNLPNVHLPSGIEFTGELKEKFHILKMPQNVKAKEVVEKLFKTMRPRELWSYVASTKRPWEHWRVLLQVTGDDIVAIKSDLEWLPLQNGGGTSLDKLLFLYSKEDSQQGLQQGLQKESLLTQLTDERVAYKRNEKSEMQQLYLGTAEQHRERVYTTQHLLSEFLQQASSIHVKEQGVKKSLFEIKNDVRAKVELIKKLLVKSYLFAHGINTHSAKNISFEQYMKAFKEAPSDLSALCQLLKMPILQPYQAMLFESASSNIKTDLLIKQLEYFSEHFHDNDHTKPIYLRLLQALKNDLQAYEKYFPRFKLLSATQQPCLPEDLCVYEEGANPAQLLDQHWSEVLFPRTTPPSDEVAATPRKRSGHAEFIKHLQTVWEGSQVNRSLLGLLLVMIEDNPQLYAAARPYLDGADPSLLRQSALKGTGRLKELEQMTTEITLIEGETKATQNLLGEPMSLQLDPVVNSLFTRPSADISIRNMHYPVYFRMIEPSQYPAEKLTDILQQTITDLYRYYGVKLVELEKTVQDARNSHEVALRVTQQMILKSAPYIWRQQLGVKDEALEIGRTLNEMEELSRRAEQYRANHEPEQCQKALEEYDQCLPRLHRLLTEHPKASEPLLQGMTRHMTNMQYSPESMPFELMQNADDALLEWEALGGSLEGRTACEWTLSGKTLTFRHRGRPINHTTSSAASFKQGHASDLDKMLKLMASDKSEAERYLAQHGGSDHLTGKFGLGFKSIYLLGKQPFIISGKLSFKVWGGVYPVRLLSDEDSKLKKEYSLCPEDTFFHLDVEDASLTRRVLEEFTEKAPLMLVFTKRINKIIINGQSFTKHITPLSPKIRLIEVVSTAPMSTESASAASAQGSLFFLVLTAFSPKQGALQLVMRVGEKGFLPLEKHWPRLWCLAPLKNTTQASFALEAPFPVDSGRAQVAADKLQLADWQDDLAQTLAALSQHLPDLAQKVDWRSTAGAMESFVEVLGLGLSAVGGSAQPKSDEADIANRLLWSLGGRGRGDGEGAARRWVSTERVFPSQLPKPYHVPVNAQVNVLPKALEPLLDFRLFTEHYPAGTLISENAAQTMGRLLGQRLPPIIPEKILDTLFPNKRVSPEVMPPLYEATKDWLTAAHFQSEKGQNGTEQWFPLSGLGIKADPWFALLSPERRLHTDYKHDAFRTLRDRMPLKLSNEDKAAAIFSATGQHCQKALDLLSDLSPNDSLWDELKKRLAGTWLQNLSQYDHKHKAVLMTNLGLFLPVAPKNETPVVKPRLRRENPLSDLQKVANWWKNESSKRLPAYEKALYGGTAPRLAQFEDGSRPDWMTLLVRARCESMGRQTPEQHAGFLKRCRQQGWLETFADPDLDPKRWQSLLHDFLTSTEDLQYYAWMDANLSYFQLARWLPEYAQLLLDLPSTPPAEQRLPLERLLSPSTRAGYQGTGLSAPSLSKPLGIGSHLCVRETLRQSKEQPQWLAGHAYMPTGRLRRWVQDLGCLLTGEEYDAKQSGKIYAWLCEKLGEQEATFGGHYDIPLQLLAGDEQLSQKVIGL